MKNNYEKKIKLIQCPCCDYYTLKSRKMYEICPICFWEDDGIDINNLDEMSGPNHITLREGRLNFLNYGACKINMIKNVLLIEKRKYYNYFKRNI